MIMSMPPVGAALCAWDVSGANVGNSGDTKTPHFAGNLKGESEMRFVIFAALAFAGTAAIGQTAPDGAQPDRAARWQAHGAEFKARFEAMRKRRADDIALLIGLRADQRPGFDAMMAAMAPHHGPDGMDGPGGKPPTAPGDEEGLSQRLDHMSAHIDERSAAGKAKIAALKSFYASLGPDQRLRFDALDRLRHDHEGMGHHGGWGGHGGHGHGGPGMAPAG
jgi:hypothetical protein